MSMLTRCCVASTESLLYQKIILNWQVHTLYFGCWIQPDVTLQGRSPPEAVVASCMFMFRGPEIQAPRSRRPSSLFGLASGRRLTSNTAVNSFVLSPLLAFRYSATSPPHHNTRLAWRCSNATRRLPCRLSRDLFRLTSMSIASNSCCPRSRPRSVP